MVIDGEIRRRCRGCNHPLALKKLPDQTFEWTHLYMFDLEKGFKEARPHHINCKCRKAEVDMQKVMVAIALQSVMKDDDTIRDNYAPDVIRDLMAHGHPCYILSDESPSYDKEIKEFLTYYEFPNIQIVSAPIAQDYPVRKIHFDFDVIVDIDPVVWENRRTYPGKHVILYTNEVNKHISEPNKRANDWSEVETLIEHIIEIRQEQLAVDL